MIGVGKVIAGRYRLERIIGAGGMGSVFEAFDELLERRVAVKVVHAQRDEAARSRFLIEARAAARFQSRHVVAIHDTGTDNALVYLVQELLTGRELAWILKEEGPLDPRWVVSLAVQTCKALSTIHETGFVHRDIKPSNLFLVVSEDGSERLVVLDFGIAKLREQIDGGITPTGILVGTPAYMAPERIHASELDGRADLFSLGVTLFELLTGAPPFKGTKPFTIMAKIVIEETPTLPGDRGSSELAAIVRRCLAKKPEERYSSAAELTEALLATPEGRAGYTRPKASTTRIAPNPAAKLVESLPLPIETGPITAPEIIFTPEPPRSPSPDLDAYLSQAGLILGAGQSPLLSIERRPDCRLPPLQLWAIVLEPEHQPLAARTMATLTFQKDALQLYSLEGTADSPHHVLALFRNPPGAGVYREWHTLATRRHVHVLPVTPSALRTAAETNRALAHLQELLRSGRRDPFEQEGRIVTDLDFFGGREDLQALLHFIEGPSAGIGVFGLEKWGTTSLLHRVRGELSDRFSAWIDLAALPSLSRASILYLVYEDLSNGLSQRGHSPPAPLSALREDTDPSLRPVLAACQAISGARPVIFFDRIDELGRSDRCSPEELGFIARAFYRLAFPRGDHPGAVLVFGGRDAHLLSSSTLGPHENPLWGAMTVRYASFFTREEMGDFMKRLGALGGLSFTHEALDKAFELTFGHKYLSRRLGSLLYRRGPLFPNGSPEVDPTGVAACTMPLITQQHAYFEAVLRRGPPGTRDVLGRLARGPCTIDELFAQEGIRNAGDPLRALEFASAYRLATEEHGCYRLTIGLLEAWLRWTGDRMRAPQPGIASPPPPPPPNPSAGEVHALEAVMRDAFSSPNDLELLAWRMHVPLASMVRLAMPLPNQIVDMVKWAVDHRRFWDLREAVRRERPNFFADGAGQTQIITLPLGRSDSRG